MGQRGPIPKPGSHDSLRGRNTYRRPARKRAKPPRLAMPTRVQAEPVAAAFWKRNAPQLLEAGRLGPEFADAFAMLALLESEIHALEKALADAGWVVDTERGPVANPAARLLRAARNDWVALARDFGITPAADARIPLEEKPVEEDDETRALRAFTAHARGA